MNKNAIKKFAIDARNKLIASVTDKAGMLGITASGIGDAITKGRDFEVYKTSAGTEVTLNRTQSEQRRRLVAQIEARGFEAVIEEVAYTWFNRICAIRFMEVNDYLSVRVLSSIKDGKTEPDIVTNAPDVDMEFSDAEKSFILEAKVENKLDELFRMLFIKQCHELNDILPELFEKTEDYTEMLLNISYTNEDDVIRMLVDTVDEKDFNVTTLGDDGKPTGQVEIIGWLYQYYNTELKDDTFAKLKKNVKVTKERIPAATQLFTPDWIVRYMVENSVGRIWIEHLRAVDPSVDEKVTAEKFGWKYYLPEAEQEESVNVKLAEIRTSYADLKPEDITCIDPCMGSGHILIAMFDVLMDIYKSTGYSEKEAAFSIVENNIYGLDIDKRAYQLAYFAVMMKGRGYNRRFFRGHDDVKPQPKVYAIQESNGINRAHIKYFGAGLSAIEKNNALNQIDGLLDAMTDAREYGSILNIDNYDWDLLRKFVSESGEEMQLSIETIGIDDTKDELIRIIDVANVLARKFLVVDTNPPYKGKGDLNAKIASVMEERFPDSKKDLFAVFIERCIDFARANAFISMITQQAWMFEDYENLRRKILCLKVENCVHLGAHAFDEISGEIVKTAAFTVSKRYIEGVKSIFINDQSPVGEKSKEESFLNQNGLYSVDVQRFYDIPEIILAYWISDRAIDIFKDFPSIKKLLNPKQGTSTGNDVKYVRYWHEIEYPSFFTRAESTEEAINSGYVYFPLDKGGEYRKWYGNNDRVIMFDKKSYNELLELGNHLPSRNLYFKEGITWSKIASQISVRYDPVGFVFSSVGLKGFPTEDFRVMLGYMNSAVVKYFARVLSPGISIVSGDIEKLPFKKPTNADEISELVNQCIEICRDEWDESELSWDFKRSPMVSIYRENNERTLEDVFEVYKLRRQNSISKLKENEELINKYFIDDYGLNTEIDYHVDDKDVSIKLLSDEELAQRLISYLVGCIFGRYTLKRDGINYAGGEIDDSLFDDLIRDDNVVPIMEEAYFSDDIVEKICVALKEAFGIENFDANLRFLVNKLPVDGENNRDILRNYFEIKFYPYHCNMYGQLPIYWLFSSGDEKGFRALTYMHRIDDTTVKTIRINYLHKAQEAIEQALSSAEFQIENGAKTADKGKLAKKITRYKKQLGEIQIYDEAIAHVANTEQRLDLKKGIKENYMLYQNIELHREGQKNQFVNLLAGMK